MKTRKGLMMSDVGITKPADIEEFFRAYNERQYDVMFEKYMAEDCFWYASEKPLRGKREILDYWLNYHSAFRETLGMPEHVVFGDAVVYLQTRIQLDFEEDGTFFGRTYRKGDICGFGCVDYYELDQERKIRSGLVYVKFFDGN